MPPESIGKQLGGLRREHLVAAVMVGAVTVVLGFASGLGVRGASAAGTPQIGMAGPTVTQPKQVASPAVGTAQAGAARPGGSQVGVRPGSRGTAAQSSSPVRRPGMDMRRPRTVPSNPGRRVRPLRRVRIQAPS